VNYQFESQESFNRAFKKGYRVSPGTYRRNRIDTIIGSRKELTAGQLRHICESLTLHPVIRHLDEKKLVGVKFQTTLRKNTQKEEWKRFGIRIEEIKNRADCDVRYGICEVSSDFDTVYFDENTESTYFIGTEVCSIDTLPEEMSVKILKNGE